MAESARSFKNWFGNTIRIPQRTVGTVGLLGADAIKTTVGVVEDFGDIANHYTDEIVNLFSKDKKWYQKALNVPVAIGKTLVGAVEAAVKPVVNGVVNTGKTALNLTTNAWKSTFGSLFSAKPVSDISFNTIKTKKKGIIHIDTDKRTLDPNKTWTSNRGTRSKAAKKAATGAAVGGAVVAPAALAAAENKAKQMQGEMEKMQGKMEEMQKKMEEMQKNFNDKLTEVLDSNQQLEDKNQTLLKDNAQKDGEIAKLKAEIEGLKKNNEKKAEVKPEPKPEVKPEPKPEKKEEKPVEAKPEKKEEKKEDKSEGKEGKGADRLSEYVESDKGKSVVNYLAKNHPDMVVKFNSSKDTGHIHLGDASEELKIGTKNTEEVPTIILHEGAHALIHDDVEGIDDLIDYVDDLNERYGKQLFPISYNKKYDTLEKRRNEDVCELIALYARDDGSFEKHMKKLQSGKNEKLAQISDGDVEKLRDLCEDVISGLNTVKMYDYDEIPLRKRA